MAAEAGSTFENEEKRSIGDGTKQRDEKTMLRMEGEEREGGEEKRREKRRGERAADLVFVCALMICTSPGRLARLSRQTDASSQGRRVSAQPLYTNPTPEHVTPSHMPRAERRLLRAATAGTGLR
jgi:hypothetical protein